MEIKPYLLLDNCFSNLQENGIILPDFSNSKRVVCFTDFAGERAEDSHYSYSFMLIDDNEMNKAVERIFMLRNQEKEWKENSLIEFKKLKKDKVRQRLLPQFLQLFDDSKALLIIFLIEKDSPHYFFQQKSETSSVLNELGYGNWKPSIIRKFNDILAIQAYLIKRFLNKETHYTWYSDRDDIFGAMGKYKIGLMDLVATYFEKYGVELKDNTFSYIFDQETSLDSDFLSIPDLAGAAVLECIEKQKGDIKKLKIWTGQILKWITNPESQFKKIVLVGYQRDNEKFLEIRS
jgi:hypothetical protein